MRLFWKQPDYILLKCSKFPFKKKPTRTTKKQQQQKNFITWGQKTAFHQNSKWSNFTLPTLVKMVVWEGQNGISHRRHFSAIMKEKIRFSHEVNIAKENVSLLVSSTGTSGWWLCQFFLYFLLFLSAVIEFGMKHLIHSILDKDHSIIK